MIKAIESEIYKISKTKDYDEAAYSVEIKEAESHIIIFKEELDEQKPKTYFKKFGS